MILLRSPPVEHRAGRAASFGSTSRPSSTTSWRSRSFAGVDVIRIEPAGVDCRSDVGKRWADMSASRSKNQRLPESEGTVLRRLPQCGDIALRQGGGVAVKWKLMLGYRLSQLTRAGPC